MAKKYSSPPPMQIDPNKHYTATIHIETGDIVAELFAKEAPITVNNFVFLAREGFYDGTTFHRVIADFMAQGGDPTGTGSGGPGYTIPGENISLDPNFQVPPKLRHTPGTLSMARSASLDSAGSQFFITFATPDFLDGKYAAFGRVTSGMDVVNSIRLRDPNPRNPAGTRILSIDISEN